MLREAAAASRGGQERGKEKARALEGHRRAESEESRPRLLRPLGNSMSAWIPPKNRL